MAKHLVAGDRLIQAVNAEQRVAAEAVALRASGAPLPGTFEAVARQWVEIIHKSKVRPGHAVRTLTRFEQDVFPWIGASSTSTQLGVWAADAFAASLR